jgi:ERCC4-type nuclease
MAEFNLELDIEPDPGVPIFDDREMASGLFDLLDKMNKSYKRATLNIGDCIISNRVCIEIKRATFTGNDLFESLKDDRIHEQSKNRHANYEINYMIIEILKGANIFNQFFTEKHFKSLCQTLELSFDTHIKISDSPEETIELIYDLWEREKKGVKYVAPINKEPYPKSLRDQQIYLLSGLDGCGDKKAEVLLKAFQSPARVFAWIINPEGVKIENFGPKFFEKNKKILLEKC